MQQASGVNYAQLRRVLVLVLQTGAVKKSGGSYTNVDIITADKHNIQETVSR